MAHQEGTLTNITFAGQLIADIYLAVIRQQKILHKILHRILQDFCKIKQSYKIW